MSAPLSQRIKSINDFNGDKNYTKAKSKLVNSRNSTYWPATHQHSLIVAKIKDWEDSHMLSLPICPNFGNRLGRKHAPLKLLSRMSKRGDYDVTRVMLIRNRLVLESTGCVKRRSIPGQVRPAAQHVRSTGGKSTGSIVVIII